MRGRAASCCACNSACWACWACWSSQLRLLALASRLLGQLLPGAQSQAAPDHHAQVYPEPDRQPQQDGSHPARASRSTVTANRVLHRELLPPAGETWPIISLRSAGPRPWPAYSYNGNRPPRKGLTNVKKALATTFGVDPDAIEITIRG